MISTQQLLEMVKEMSAIIQQNKDCLTELGRRHAEAAALRLKD